MVVATTVTKNVYSGDGSNKLFPFTFRVGAASDIVLFSTVIATGVTTTISASDYSLVVNGNLVGGTVTYPLGPDAAVASTSKITVARARPYVQPVQVENQTRFFPSVLADGLDNLAMQVQQVNEEVSRAVKNNISETSVITYADIVAQQLAAAASAAAADADATQVALDLIATDADMIATAADRVQTGLDRTAVAADLVLTDADTVATAADRVQTGLDRTQTVADRVQTGLDRTAAEASAVASAADAVQTALDRTAVAADLVLTDADTVATAADRVQTGLDKTATAADRVQTGLDETATAADRVQTGLDRVQTVADRVQTALDRTAVDADRTAVAADRSTVAADKATTIAAKDAALLAFAGFEDVYLGPYATDPTLDNDGSALEAGDLYYDTTNNVMKVWLGAAWGAAYVSAAGVLLVSNDLSDLANASTALTNLGLTADAKTLVTAVNFAAMRTALGLVPQTSNTDATVGRLLTPGAFGLGQTTTSPLLANIDATDTPGSLARYDATTTGTQPPTFSTTGTVLTVRGAGTNNLSQLAISANGQEMWYRSCVAGVFIAWRKPTFDLGLPQVENSFSTVFGYVSGQRLAQAVRANLNVAGSAPIYACRAWVNFNGTGTVAIRASGNVSSITDNGVGDYTVNFATALPDVNFAMAGSASADEAGRIMTVDEPVGGTRTTSSVRVRTGWSGANNAFGLLRDNTIVSIAIFR